MASDDILLDTRPGLTVYKRNGRVVWRGDKEWTKEQVLEELRRCSEFHDTRSDLAEALANALRSQQ